MIIKLVTITFTLLIANTNAFDFGSMMKEMEKALRQNPNMKNEMEKTLRQNPNMRNEMEKTLRKNPNMRNEMEKALRQNPNMTKELEKMFSQNPNTTNNLTNTDRVIGGINNSVINPDKNNETNQFGSSCELTICMAYQSRKICKLFYKFKKSHLTAKGRELLENVERDLPPNEEFDNITRTHVVQKDKDPFLASMCSATAQMLRDGKKECAEYFKVGSKFDSSEDTWSENMMENLFEHFGDELDFDPNGKCPARPNEPQIDG